MRDAGAWLSHAYNRAIEQLLLCPIIDFVRGWRTAEAVSCAVSLARDLRRSNKRLMRHVSVVIVQYHVFKQRCAAVYCVTN